jgi:hypothetical protein
MHADVTAVSVRNARILRCMISAYIVTCDTGDLCLCLRFFMSNERKASTYLIAIDVMFLRYFPERGRYRLAISIFEVGKTMSDLGEPEVWAAGPAPLVH